MHHSYNLYSLRSKDCSEYQKEALYTLAQKIPTRREPELKTRVIVTVLTKYHYQRHEYKIYVHKYNQAAEGLGHHLRSWNVQRTVEKCCHIYRIKRQQAHSHQRLMPNGLRETDGAGVWHRLPHATCQRALWAQMLLNNLSCHTYLLGIFFIPAHLRTCLGKPTNVSV